jgi:hypothetical protein
VLRNLVRSLRRSQDEQAAEDAALLERLAAAGVA